MSWDSCKTQIIFLNSNSVKSLKIKKKARELGFLDCGITKAEHLGEDALRLAGWLKNNHHGEMHYMQRHFEKRADPRRLLEGANSVIVVIQNYYTNDKQLEKSLIELGIMI